jgi:Bacterial SH3 domain
MRRLGRWWAIWLVMLCGGCGFGRPFNYHDAVPRLDASGTGKVVATQDQRPYIVSGKARPDFVGLVRSPAGIPYAVYTQGERPLAQEMTYLVCQALEQRGFRCLPATVMPQATSEETHRVLTGRGQVPAVFLTIREWKSDTPTDTSLAYNATLRVLDVQGAVLAQTHIEGREGLGWGAHEKVPQAVQRKLETLLNEPTMTTALEALNQPPSATPSVAFQPSAPAMPPVLPLSSQPPTPREGVRLQAQYDAFRLFLQPDTNAERLSQVPASAVLRVLEARGNWLYVETPNQQRGWILQEWIEQ